MKVLARWNEIPAFASPEKEAEFWSETSLDAALMKGAILKNDVRDISVLTLRVDPRMVARIKRLAGSRYLDYQHMIRQWLAERMEQEMDR